MDDNILTLIYSDVMFKLVSVNQESTCGIRESWLIINEFNFGALLRFSES